MLGEDVDDTGVTDLATTAPALSCRDGEIVWQADAERKRRSGMYRFAVWLGQRFPACRYDFHNYNDLHRFSLVEAARFWHACAEFCGFIWQHHPSLTYRDDGEGMLGRCWFPEARFNYCQNLLQRGNDDDVALYSYVEGQAGIATVTRRQLRDDVGRGVAVLRSLGVRKGDVVCGVLSNVPAAVVAALATAAIGAVWSSCSPDFGAQGISDRLQQIDPKVIFFTTAYIYGQKRYDRRAAMQTVLRKFPHSHAVAVAHLDDADSRDTLNFTTLLANAANHALTYAEMDFAAPLFILFSSGTTGVPKCIVHSGGGTLLQHLKEHAIHGDLGRGDRLMFYTTCGWMMWNWQLSALAVGTAIGLYEGAPHRPRATTLWEVAARTASTAVGLSPRYLDVCAQKTTVALPALRTVFSTGAPLSGSHYRYIYGRIKADVHLVSISGGTDIISCFMLGNVLLPVRVGEIQVKGLGMAVAAWGRDGESLVAAQGELVCTAPFVSMPRGFLHDPDGSRFRQAYFNFFPDHEVWRHGDFITITAHGSIRMHGRSDAVLNPHGIRIGTAEIYRQLEQLVEITDAVVVDYQRGSDSSMVLFVVLTAGQQLDTALQQKIKKTIATGLTPRHVPRHIIQVPDIPYTVNGKKVELAVKRALAGETIHNRSALANPQALDFFVKLSQDFAAIAKEQR